MHAGPSLLQNYYPLEDLNNWQMNLKLRFIIYIRSNTNLLAATRNRSRRATIWIVMVHVSHVKINTRPTFIGFTTSLDWALIWRFSCFQIIAKFFHVNILPWHRCHDVCFNFQQMIATKNSNICVTFARLFPSWYEYIP